MKLFTANVHAHNLPQIGVEQPSAWGSLLAAVVIGLIATVIVTSIVNR